MGSQALVVSLSNREPRGTHFHPSLAPHRAMMTWNDVILHVRVHLVVPKVAYPRRHRLRSIGQQVEKYGEVVAGAARYDAEMPGAVIEEQFG